MLLKGLVVEQHTGTNYLALFDIFKVYVVFITQCFLLLMLLNSFSSASSFNSWTKDIVWEYLIWAFFLIHRLTMLKFFNGKSGIKSLRIVGHTKVVRTAACFENLRKIIAEYFLSVARYPRSHSFRVLVNWLTSPVSHNVTSIRFVALLGYDFSVTILSDLANACKHY